MTADDVTLTEAERGALSHAFRSSSRSPDHLAFLAAPAVGRILADRLAAVQAEADWWQEMHRVAFKAGIFQQDRAESAERRLAEVKAERDALRADVQEVIDARGRGDFAALLPKLRAALANPPAEEES